LDFRAGGHNHCVCVVVTVDQRRDAIPKGTVAIANVAVDIDADNALFEKVREIKEESKFTGVVLRGMFDGSEQDTEVKKNSSWIPHSQKTSFTEETAILRLFCVYLMFSNPSPAHTTWLLFCVFALPVRRCSGRLHF